MKTERRIVKSWTLLEQAFRCALLRRGFLQIPAPIFTDAGLESYGGGAFQVDYYGRPAFLSQSPQRYKQLGIQKGLKKIFTVSENIRKPSSQQTDFSTEFTSWDFEMVGITHLERLSAFTETIIRESLPASKQPARALVLTFEKACRLLNEHGDVRAGTGLDTAAQKKLARIIQRTTGKQLYIVTHFPADTRAFYYGQTPAGAERQALCFDIVFHGIEIGSGGIHEHRYAHLRNQAKKRYTRLGALTHYLDIFKNRMPPHGGVSFSPARIVQAILKLPSTKEATLFPRTPTVLSP